MGERDGIQIEMKKNSLKQLQSGDWIVSFTSSQIDFPTELATAAMGQRFMAVLVPLGDFEDVPTSQQTSQQTSQKLASTAIGHKRKLSQQAAMLCDDRPFQLYLNERFAGVCCSADAAAAVRLCCNVDSRSEFDTDPEAAARWRNLKAEYEAWLRT
jgi:hypothetical protein